MSAHTPGPWDDASKYPGVASVRIFANTRYIATVGNSDDTPEQIEANARLIAAAPDLLAALSLDDIEQIAEGIDHFIIGGDEQLVPIWQPYIDKLNRLRAVIQKAQSA